MKVRNRVALVILSFIFLLLIWNASAKHVQAATDTKMTKTEVTTKLKSMKKKIRKDPQKYFIDSYAESILLYSIKDIDEDGYNELIVECFFSGDFCSGILFDYYNGKIIKNEYSGMIRSGGKFIQVERPEMGVGSYTYFYTLKKGKLHKKIMIGTTWGKDNQVDGNYVNDKKVTEVKMKKILKKYQKKSKIKINMKSL